MDEWKIYDLHTNYKNFFFIPNSSPPGPQTSGDPPVRPPILVREGGPGYIVREGGPGYIVRERGPSGSRAPDVSRAPRGSGEDWGEGGGQRAWTRPSIKTLVDGLLVTTPHYSGEGGLEGY